MAAIDGKGSIGTVTEIASYVIFTLGDETYGIDVMMAQEVQNYTGINHVPDTLPFMKGVINLRGTIVPVVDLRIKFGMEEKKYTDQTVIIIADLHGQKAGLVVDSVVDVLNIPMSQVQHSHHFTINIDTDSVAGIAKVNEQIIVILDGEKVVTSEEMQGITSSGRR